MSKPTSTISKLATLLSLLPASLSSPVHLRPRQSSYPGWSSIQNFFVFGDSYTTTSFLPNSTQPSASNPLGNPAYPGYTSSNGPNWVDYLTIKYNASTLLTYNLAYGGATVDSALVAQYLPTVLDLSQQINDEFLPTYTPQNSTAQWSSSTSLFGIFIGINDVGNSYYAQNTTLNDAIFAEYSSLVDTLYGAGARNFLFLNVPPVDRSPLTTQQGGDGAALEAADIADFNGRIQGLASGLAKDEPDTAVFLFDDHTLFGNVLDDPSQFPETALYKDTETYCAAYQKYAPPPIIPFLFHAMRTDDSVLAARPTQIPPTPPARTR
ncbi:MAG: hypothetical protein Q9160_001888 [Pyrenula sp. 1 TL-2023]